MLTHGKRKRHRIRFEREAMTDDGYGNTRGAWQTVCERWAAFRPRFGREQVEAGTLESSLTGTLTVLRDAQTELVTPGDRLIFIIGPLRGQICNIRAVIPTSREIEFTLEAGVAT